MRKCCLAALATVSIVNMWAADWPMPGGNPQRNSWAGSEHQISKTNISQLKLLFKYQVDNASKGSAGLGSPIISGNLITFRGFKEMLMFTNSSGKVFSVDADLNHLLWESDGPSQTTDDPRAATATCPAGSTAPLIMAGSSSSALHFAALASQTPAVAGTSPLPRRSPYWPPLAQTLYPLLPTTLTQLDALYTVTSDGHLHVINSSTGEDLLPAVRFLPPNAKVTSLNLRDNVVYATTGNNCDGHQNALYALDLLSPEKTVALFILPRGEFDGTAGTTIGNDGTVYVQVPFALPDKSFRYYEAVVALTPKELKLKDYVLLSKKPIKGSLNGVGITPGVFSYPGRDLLIAAGRDGRVHLLDSRSLGGADHLKPLFSGDVLVNARKSRGGQFQGSFSTWLDVDTGKRTFYASRLATGKSSIAAFEISGTNEQPSLTSIWSSQNITAPSSPVIANSMLFVLSNASASLDEPMRLVVLDANTGQELQSVDTGASTTVSTGLALANGRVYFTARDNAVYCFGIPSQHTQLVKQ